MVFIPEKSSFPDGCFRKNRLKFSNSFSRSNPVCSEMKLISSSDSLGLTVLFNLLDILLTKLVPCLDDLCPVPFLICASAKLPCSILAAIVQVLVNHLTQPRLAINSPPRHPLDQAC